MSRADRGLLLWLYAACMLVTVSCLDRVQSEQVLGVRKWG